MNTSHRPNTRGTTLARFLSAPTAFLIAGYSLSFSQNSVPILYNQPAKIATSIFAPIFYQGASFVIPLSVISAAASGYLAYSFPKQRKMFLAAVGFSVSLGPWTSLVMGPGIARLLEIGGDEALIRAADGSGEVVRLLKTWVAQNYARAAFAFVAGMLSAIGVWRKNERRALAAKEA